jgi:hypothetical protein
MTFPRRLPPIPPDVPINRNPAPTVQNMVMTFLSCAAGYEILMAGCLIAFLVLLCAVGFFFFVSGIDRRNQ